MKKVLVVVGILMIFCAIGLCETDFSSYTDEDLILLYADLKNEIGVRQLNETTVVPEGIYKCGVDFPEGSYLFFKDTGRFFLSIDEDLSKVDTNHAKLTIDEEGPYKTVLCISEGLYLSLVEGITMTRNDPLFK